MPQVTVPIPQCCCHLKSGYAAYHDRSTLCVYASTQVEVSRAGRVSFCHLSEQTISTDMTHQIFLESWPAQASLSQEVGASMGRLESGNKAPIGDMVIGLLGCPHLPYLQH